MQTLTVELRTLQGESLGVLLLKEKTFSTGRTGYFGTAKIEIDGQRCQCQAQAVVIEKRESAPTGAA